MNLPFFRLPALIEFYPKTYEGFQLHANVTSYPSLQQDVLTCSVNVKR